jgi:hypothetical protein
MLEPATHKSLRGGRGRLFRAAELFPLRGEVAERVAGKGLLQSRQLGEIVVGAEGHLPDIASVPVDGVTAQGFVGTGRTALTNDDEAVEAGREIAAQVHAVHLDVGIAQIDIVVMSDKGGDLVCLPRSDLAVGRLRGSADDSGDRKGHTQEEGENRATHVSSLMVRGRAMQYNSR